MATLSDMKYKKYFAQFVEELDKKMEKGFLEHSDKSFDKPTNNLICEMQQEVIDLAGWGLVLWIKLEEMKNEMGEKR